METRARLIAKYPEPKLPGCQVLIAKNDDNDNSNAPDSRGWCFCTADESGNAGRWSSIGEVELLHGILIGHLSIPQADAEAMIECAHNDGLTVDARLQLRIK